MSSPIAEHELGDDGHVIVKLAPPMGKNGTLSVKRKKAMVNSANDRIRD